MDDRELYLLAVKARERSYSPYSRFRVGAALLAMDGGIQGDEKRLCAVFELSCRCCRTDR